MCSFYLSGNNNLSTVVLTQNNLCNIIPDINEMIHERKKDIFVVNDMTNANKNVNMTSTIAILKIRYECGPFPGSPNIFLYLHNDINKHFIFIILFT